MMMRQRFSPKLSLNFRACGPLVALALAAAAPVPAGPAPRFDPILFFAGHTEGTGELKIVLHHRRSVRVHGLGTPQADGSILLEQTVDGAGERQQQRAWRIRKVAPGQYAGTLTEAPEGIVGESIGDAFHLKYHSRSGTAIEQWIVLAADGRSAQNRLVAHKLGVVVARLDETIRKID